MRNSEHIKNAIEFEQLVLRLLKAEALANNQVLLSGVEAGRSYRFVDAVALDGFMDLPGPCLIEIKFRADMYSCLLYTSPSPRDGLLSRMPSSA